MSRFTPTVEAALRAAGWTPGRSIGRDRLQAIEDTIAGHPTEFGGRLRPSPAALEVLDEFGGLVLGGEEDGLELSPRPFVFDPSLAVHQVEAIVDASRVAGFMLYPVGAEGLDDAVLVVDFHGRVLSIDATGEYLLGDRIETALDTLITGRRPPLLDDRGDWPGQTRPEPVPENPDDVMVLATFNRPSGAAFFLPRTPSNLHHVWLPNTLRLMGLEPTADPADPGQLQVDWGEMRCRALVLDLDVYTVLLLVFNQEHARRQIRADAQRPESDDDAPLALAFRRACRALGPELTVAFIETRTKHRLDRWVAEREFDVLTVDIWALVDEGFSLLYLDERYSADVPKPLAGRDEIYMLSGRMIFAGAGAERWY